MTDRMTPISFANLMEQIFGEYRLHHTVFGVHKMYTAQAGRELDMFGGKLETPFGPAAGPNTQLAQNIIAAYFAGSRFFELKTVQKLDGEDLPVAKPCILAEDEGYNVEWSTELYVPQAQDEYIKAWWACRIMAAEFGLGSPDGFVFNMSVGYDLEGIKSPKIDSFIENLKDASKTAIWQECRAWALSHAGGLSQEQDKAEIRFTHLTARDIEAFSPRICNSITLSTLHGCPAADIEKIASYLLTEKKLNTFIKCNPTLLGYDYARKTLNDMGFDYVEFGDFHFLDDLQYSDCVPMLKRLGALAESEKLSFGVKLTNTFPVDIKRKELPGEEMYMSGRSLYVLSLSVAQKLSRDFGGRLRISFSGGADAFNITKLYSVGIWPITFATTILKPGGYNRIGQIAKEFEKVEYKPFEGIDCNGLDRLLDEAFRDKHNIKPVKQRPSRKVKKDIPLFDCFAASCQMGCPVHQDITEYMQLVSKGRNLDALKVIALKNPLPNITGTICAHECMSRCTRNFYESPVAIREMKLKATAANKEFESYLEREKGKIVQNNIKTAVVGAGPAGIAASYFLARAGFDVTVYDSRTSGGGTVRHVINRSRISDEAISQDIRFAEKLGVKFVYNHRINNIDELKKEGYRYVIVAVGAGKPGVLKLEGCEPVNAIGFLEAVNLGKVAVDADSSRASGYDEGGAVHVGKTIVVIGGGNTAMDTARAAKALQGVERVYLVYRRDRRNMPASEEELELALKDGVEFKELLSPFAYTDGKLFCRRNELGEYDEKGRRMPVETDRIIPIKADTVIAAVGEKVDTQLMHALELEIDTKGFPVTDENNMSSIDCVYVAGDSRKGPATIIEAVRDVSKAVRDICHRSGIDGEAGNIVAEAKELIKEIHDSTKVEELISKKGVLAENVATSAAGEGIPAEKAASAAGEGVLEAGVSCDAERCLGCSTICENCVDVCPNRANIAVDVPIEGTSLKRPAIVHIDRMCNECGNCATFCPYSGRPYKDKFTLFHNLKDFRESTNQGFVLLDAESRTFRIRYDGMTTDEEPFEEFCSLEYDVRETVKAVYNDFRFLF